MLQIQLPVIKEVPLAELVASETTPGINTKEIDIHSINTEMQFNALEDKLISQLSSNVEMSKLMNENILNGKNYTVSPIEMCLHRHNELPYCKDEFEELELQMQIKPTQS